jgi:hypothetical protein
MAEGIYILLGILKYKSEDRLVKSSCFAFPFGFDRFANDRLRKPVAPALSLSFSVSCQFFVSLALAGKQKIDCFKYSCSVSGLALPPAAIKRRN